MLPSDDRRFIARELRPKRAAALLPGSAGVSGLPCVIEPPPPFSGLPLASFFSFPTVKMLSRGRRVALRVSSSDAFAPASFERNA